MISHPYDLLLVLLVFMLTSCGMNEKVVGLWQIETVKVDQQEMTPVAKWTRLNKDKSQASGNGWLQHAVGSWEIDARENKISISNTNGIADEYGAFALSLENGKMVWSRVEEGQQVEITLIRIENIPQAPFNQLLGVWKLMSQKHTDLEDALSYLHIRWDQIIMLKNIDGKRSYGVYKTHGHKNELQVIYYEEPLRSEIWNYYFDSEDNLVLTTENKGESISLKYERINYFPK